MLRMLDGDESEKLKMAANREHKSQQVFCERLYRAKIGGEGKAINVMKPLKRAVLVKTAPSSNPSSLVSERRRIMTRLQEIDQMESSRPQSTQSSVMSDISSVASFATFASKSSHHYNQTVVPSHIPRLW